MENFAGIYLRVSSEDQHPENQIADVKRLAEALGFKVFETYVDRESGQYSDRREFQRMTADAEAGKFKMLFIWALDRFSREGIKTTLTHIEKLKEIGVTVRSYQEQWLDTSNEGIWQLLVAIIAWAANQELKRLKERSMAGKRRMLSEGKLIGCYPSYGWDYVRRDKEKGIDGYFKINGKEARITKKIYTWYIELESYFLVAKRLYEKGIKSRGRNGLPRYFCASTIKKILTSESYIGNHYYGKSSPALAKFHIKKVRKHKLTGRTKNQKSEWKLVKIPPIIDESTFYRVQEIIEKRSSQRTKLKQSKYEFLCQSLIRCIRCGRLYGTKIQNEFLLYACPQRRTVSFNEPPCRSRTISRRKIDEIVWAYTKRLIENYELINQNVALLREKRSKNITANQRLCDSLLDEKSQIKKQASKLLELYSLSESDNVKNDIRIKLVEFDEREKSVDKQIVGVKKELQGFDDMRAVEDEIKRLCFVYKNKTKNPSFKLKRLIVKKWVSEINILDDGRIKIKVKIPDGVPFEGLNLNVVNNDIPYTRKVVKVKVFTNKFNI